MKKLLRTVPQVGRIEWIGRSPVRKAPIEILDGAEFVAGEGLVGDHHGKLGSRRQVTLIQWEHLRAIACLLPDAAPDADPIAPERCRRNLVVAGLNLLSLKDLVFEVGDHVVLRGTGPCPPCSRMEAEFGPGGYQAMRGHGGITAEVLESGTVRIGDTVRTRPIEGDLEDPGG